MYGLVIVARQRTGTHLLRGALSNSTNAYDVSEILHPEIRDIQGNFFKWYFEKNETIPANRSFEWCVKLFDEYIDFLEIECVVPMIDFKYNLFTSFNPTWRSPAELPLLLQRFMKRRYKIIHLIRRSRIETIVSQLIADKSGRFVITETEETKDQAPIEINVGEFNYLIKLYERELKYIEPWLSQYVKTSEIYYEDIVEAVDDGSMENFLRRVIEDTDIKFFEYRPATVQKIVPDWRKAVSNAAEIENEAKKLGVK